jgi:hypothetical protein
MWMTRNFVALQVILSLWAEKSLLSQEAPSSYQVLHYAKQQLEHHGTLKSAGGLLYLDVDNAYIHELIPFLSDHGFEAPGYFGHPDLIGAHITVIYPHEVEAGDLTNIEEYGSTIHFTIVGTNVVRPARWRGVEEAYLLTIDAPELDQLRKKYGLPPSLYLFHITLGIRTEASNKARISCKSMQSLARCFMP